MIFRKTLRSMIAMSEGAWLLTLRGVQLGCALLLGAIVLLIDCGGDLITNYRQYITALSLNELCQAVLLVSLLASVCVEDLNRRA